MNKIFTPQVLKQLKVEINKSLKGTLNLMFNFDISLLHPSAVLEKKTEAYPAQASVFLRAIDTEAVLCVNIPMNIVREIAEKIGPGEISKESMIQDVACEIANIVGHAIQVYFARLPSHIMFEVDIPKPGFVLPDFSPENTGIIRLPTPENLLDPIILSFVFSKAS